MNDQNLQNSNAGNTVVKKPDNIGIEIIIAYYQYVKKRIVWIILALIIGCAAGVLYAKLQKPKYVGEVKFASKSESNSNSYAMFAQQLGINVGSGGDAFSGDNIMAFLKTRSMIENTLLTQASINGKKQLLADYYLDHFGVRQSWNNENSKLKNISFTADRNTFTINQDSALKLIYQTVVPSLIVSKPDESLNIISVSVESTDEYWAKYFCETLVNNVINFHIASTTQNITENINILQKKVDSVNRNVAGNLSEIAVSQDININPIKKSQQIPNQKRQISLETNRAIYGQLIQNLEAAKIQLSRQTPSVQIIDTPVLPLDVKVTSTLLSGIIGAAAATFLVTAFFTVMFQYNRLKAKYF